MMFNLFRKKKTTFLMDENVKMSQEDIDKFPECQVINSTEYFKKGTDDEKLTNMAKREKWTIVTKDIRMALRSLIADVPVIYISDEFKCVSMLTVNIYGRDYFPDMFDYIHKRFGYDE